MARVCEMDAGTFRRVLETIPDDELRRHVIDRYDGRVAEAMIGAPYTYGAYQLVTLL